MVDVGRLGFGFRVRWDEELAAVLIGDRRAIKGADLSRLIDNLLLVYADQGLEVAATV